MAEYMADLINEWAARTQRDWGDELGYPEKAAFVQMQGGAVGLPPAEESHIERIGKAIWAAGPVERLVIHAHFRRHASYPRIADTLSKMTGRTVWVREVGKLVAKAVEKAERAYHVDEMAA